MLLSTGLRNYMLDSGLGSAFDTDGIIEARTGAAPSADAALTGTVVYSVALSSDALAAAASGAVAINGTPLSDSSADSTNTVGHVVIRKSGDGTGASATLRRMFLTVGAGSGEVNHDNLAISSGQQVTISSGSFTQPAS